MGPGLPLSRPSVGRPALGDDGAAGDGHGSRRCERNVVGPLSSNATVSLSDADRQWRRFMCSSGERTRVYEESGSSRPWCPPPLPVNCRAAPDRCSGRRHKFDAGQGRKVHALTAFPACAVCPSRPARPRFLRGAVNFSARIVIESGVRPFRMTETRRVPRRAQGGLPQPERRDERGRTTGGVTARGRLLPQMRSASP